jgi:hypothetical protein
VNLPTMNQHFLGSENALRSKVAAKGVRVC